ncbi:hypothetical protein SEA_EDEN_14 [Microbacterium phage Eden]|uniref:Uncharacterized protein n=1 Tax=Microbacterium phage Eden TaxID=2250289 RepID=A0A345KWA7_9CAUD|nr:hypothetical protein HOT71_gp14 [Microbacterium phage Eden]AXH47309.1 hypothetical protein SEA_EDEN_14 [Microbacterium phage Eden]
MNSNENIVPAWLVVGAVIEHNEETGWPTFRVTGVVPAPTAKVCGRPIGAYVTGEWADRPGQFASLHLPSVIKEWHLA